MELDFSQLLSHNLLDPRFTMDTSHMCEWLRPRKVKVTQVTNSQTQIESEQMMSGCGSALCLFGEQPRSSEESSDTRSPSSITDQSSTGEPWLSEKENENPNPYLVRVADSSSTVRCDLSQNTYIVDVGPDINDIWISHYGTKVVLKVISSAIYGSKNRRGKLARLAYGFRTLDRRIKIPYRLLVLLAGSGRTIWKRATENSIGTACLMHNIVEQRDK